MRNVFIILALVFSISVGTAKANTTLLVTLSTDNDPGGAGELGDLRYVLNAMNQDLNTMPDDYAIVFAAPMTIQLNGILPIINNSSHAVNITIGNPGTTPTVTIDGNNGAYSGFFIPIGNVTIQNMSFQNLAARGGNGGDGISGGGGGMGAGGAIYAPQTFLNGSYPSITLMNVFINNSAAIGGNGGNYVGGSSTGDEGGGGGGGFSGNGGSIVTTGQTGGGGGGGFGGDGGNVTLSVDFNGGGGGGGGLGSRASIGTPSNLGHGGSDQSVGLDGNGYGLSIVAGSGGGGNSGGNNAGGGGGGGGSGFSLPGGGGGGSAGTDGSPAQGVTPALVASDPIASGGNGGDGAGGGGGGVVAVALTNDVDGKAGSGGYGGGGGGAAGTGAYDVSYSVQGGLGGVGGGGGGGGVNQSGSTPADGGNSLGGGGGAGGGPSNGLTASGGTDTGNLGGGSGGIGANTYGSGFGGGGGGGGSGLGGAIFVDSNLNFTLQALSGVPTIFNTSNNTTQAGVHGTGGAGGGSDGTDGSALGNSIFLRRGSSLTLRAQDAGDVLTLGDQVAFTDDTIFGAGGTSVFVTGNGTVVYNGTTDYQGYVKIDNANLKVNGQIGAAPVAVCRNSSMSSQRGMLSGIGTLAGDVFVNSGTIAPDPGTTLTLGSLVLNSASGNALGSLVKIAIGSNGTSLVSVNGPTSLAGILQIALDPQAMPGSYVILTSTAITGAFDSVEITGVTATPLYSINYQPTFVEFVFTGLEPTATPVAQFSPGSIDFGTQPIHSADQISVTLSNAGNSDLTLNGFSISGAFSAADDCPATLAPNASCTVQITFSPDAVGNHSGVLSLNSNAPGAPAAVTLSGVGAASEHEVTATVAHGGGTISPAAVTVAEGQAQAFTVTPAAGYSISSVSGCGGSLSGSTFTTAPISEACSVTAVFAVVVTAHGKGGGGSMNFLTLGGLLITLLARCFRRRFCGGVALLLALPCVTQAGDFNSWYGGVRLGSARTNMSSADVNHRLDDLGYGVSARVEDSGRTAWGVFGGWRVSQHFGTQFGYTHLGNVDTVFTGDVLDIQAFLRDANRLQPRSASGFELNLVGRYPLGKGFELAAQLGAFAWNADYTVSNSRGDFLKREDNGLDLTYGAGLEYGLDGGLAFTGGWTRYKVGSESIDFLGVGLQYRSH